MAEALRIPITNVFGGSHYTMALTFGADATPLNLLLDTGAGLLVVDGGGYDPSGDSTAKTTKLLQTAPFETGDFLAAVVQTSVGLAGTPVVLAGANVAVTYQEQPGLFGNADGILGLAYAALDSALRMPADTFLARFPANQLGVGQPAGLEPFISQMATAGLAPEIFAFVVSRSNTSQALEDPSTDPVNNGLFILGGGPDCTDLYRGAFTNVAVVHQRYYHTNLLAVEVGAQTITVPPAATGGLVFSNSIIDSGAGSLRLGRGLYMKVIAAFAAVRPGFAALLQSAAATAGQGCDQATLTLGDWPALILVFEGSDGTPARVEIAPQDYWQFDCGRKGRAVAMIAGDNGGMAGQSILGLPLFCNRFVVFDRTAGHGLGVISFADRPEAPLVA